MTSPSFVRRCDMKPGTIFGVYGPQWVEAIHQFVHAAGAYVVIDRHTEVNFWTGDDWVIGAICPEMTFEVLS